MAEKKSAWAALGKRIKEERQRRGLTQQALADAAQLTNRYISNIECGARQPATKALQAIAGALKIQPRDLFTGVPSTYQPLDADLAQLASLFKEATADDRATVLSMARAIIRRKK